MNNKRKSFVNCCVHIAQLQSFREELITLRHVWRVRPQVDRQTLRSNHVPHFAVRPLRLTIQIQVEGFPAEVIKSTKIVTERPRDGPCRGKISNVTGGCSVSFEIPSSRCKGWCYIVTMSCLHLVPFLKTFNVRYNRMLLKFG